MRFQRIIFSVLALIVFAVSARATSTTVYTDQTAFNNATLGVFFQNLAFTPDQLSSSTGYTDSSGIIITDYISNNSALSVSSGNLVDNGWGFAASLPNIVYDFWFTVTAPVSSSLQVSFTAPDGPYSNTFNVPGSGVFFFGVTSTAPITNLVFHNGYAHPDTITAFSFAEPAETPEAATLLLIGSGLIAMRWLKKRGARRGEEPQERSAAAGYVTPQIAAS